MEAAGGWLGSVEELRLLVRREEMDMESPRSVTKDEALVFLEMRLEVEENILDVSL
jgi:hypothetical protein